MSDLPKLSLPPGFLPPPSRWYGLPVVEGGGTGSLYGHRGVVAQTPNDHEVWVEFEAHDGGLRKVRDLGVDLMSPFLEPAVRAILHHFHESPVFTPRLEPFRHRGCHGWRFKPTNLPWFYEQSDQAIMNRGFWVPGLVAARLKEADSDYRARLALLHIGKSIVEKTLVNEALP